MEKIAPLIANSVRDVVTLTLRPHLTAKVHHEHYYVGTIHFNYSNDGWLVSITFFEPAHQLVDGKNTRVLHIKENDVFTEICFTSASTEISHTVMAGTLFYSERAHGPVHKITIRGKKTSTLVYNVTRGVASAEPYQFGTPQAEFVKQNEWSVEDDFLIYRDPDDVMQYIIMQKPRFVEYRFFGDNTCVALYDSRSKTLTAHTIKW